MPITTTQRDWSVPCMFAYSCIPRKAQRLSSRAAEGSPVERMVSPQAASTRKPRAPHQSPRRCSRNNGSGFTAHALRRFHSPTRKGNSIQKHLTSREVLVEGLAFKPLALLALVENIWAVLLVGLTISELHGTKAIAFIEPPCAKIRLERVQANR